MYIFIALAQDCLGLYERKMIFEINTLQLWVCVQEY